MSSRHSTQNQVDNWLNSWGFKENPFRYWEANREAHIDEYYIKHKFYEQLLTSENPTMVFAYRGEGKSATRIMIQKECQPQNRISKVFAIPFSDFSYIVEINTRNNKISFADYLPFLINEGLISLLGASTFSMRENIQFTDNDISKIKFWVELYAPRILENQRIDNLIKEIWRRGSNSQFNIPRIDSWKKNIVENTNRFINLSNEENPYWKNFLSLWRSLQKANMTGFDEWKAQINKSSSKEVVQFFVLFILDMLSKGKRPCEMIVFLFDGIDEHDETRNSPELSSKILSPLLWEMWFHRIDGLVNKFFLPMEQKPSFVNADTRWDLFEVYDLDWRYSDKLLEIDLMKKLLRERIYFFNSEGKNSISHMCEPEIGRFIEDEMIAESDKSPRNLIRLGNALFQEHCERDAEPKSLITLKEWESALRKYRATSHMARQEARPEISKKTSTKPDTMPNLIIKQAARKVFRGEEEIALSAIEFDLLLELNRKINQICSEEELIESLYKQTYTKKLADNLRSHIRHLRKKIEAGEQKKFSYIKNVRGRGYMLENVER